MGAYCSTVSGNRFAGVPRGRSVAESGSPAITILRIPSDSHGDSFHQLLSRIRMHARLCGQSPASNPQQHQLRLLIAQNFDASGHDGSPHSDIQDELHETHPRQICGACIYVLVTTPRRWFDDDTVKTLPIEKRCERCVPYLERMSWRKLRLVATWTAQCDRQVPAYSGGAGT